MLYLAAPFARASTGTSAATAGVSGTWLTGLSVLQTIVAVTALVALTLAMSKLIPLRRREWARSPIARPPAVAVPNAQGPLR